MCIECVCVARHFNQACAGSCASKATQANESANKRQEETVGGGGKEGEGTEGEEVAQACPADSLEVAARGRGVAMTCWQPMMANRANSDAFK